MRSKTIVIFFSGFLATSAFAQTTVGTPAGVSPGALGAPAGVANGTPGAPFGSTATPIGGGTLPNTVVSPNGTNTLPGSGSASTGSSAGVAPSVTTFGSTTVVPTPGTTPQSSRGVLGPAPASPGVVSSPGVVTGNSPFPCVIGSATNPC